jgi:asparagine synthase (glutamine-hydrolysing)
MCGISGYVLKDSGPLSSPELLRAMTGTIAHRGPDDEGYSLINRRTGHGADFSGPASPAQIRHSLAPIERANEWARANGPDLFLGHRRFAIISPTPEGHQPFRDAGGDVLLSFNGEIYNYIELRNELAALGVNFRTATDTEVLVEAYKAWGMDCFRKLNGMWAISLYDFRRRQLILSRDRTGERPLYWVRTGEGIFFASEIKALISNDSIYPRRVVNEGAVLNFLHQAVCDLDVGTFFQGIESMPAASVVTIDADNKIEVSRFWRAPEPGSRATREDNISDTTQELRALLQDCVALRLRADVPVNVALSGGLDSSSVVALAAGLRSQGLDTYTVRFDEPEWNEWPYAAAVAKMYNVRNLVAEPQAKWTWAFLERFVTSMEEPFHAPDLVPDHVVRRILASRGFKVTLSGIGGDELFAGYENYRGFYAAELKHEGRWVRGLRELLLASEKSPLKAGRDLLVGRLGRLFAKQGREGLASQAITASSAALRSLPESISERLQSDIEWSLLPYWLRAGDKSSMAIPIEVRYPFLDHRLIEFAARLPLSYLIRDGWLKWILRKAMEGMLPAGIAWRRKKMGFPFPIVEILSGSLDQLHSVFSAMDNPYLQRQFWTGRLDLAVQQSPWLVWRALSLELWHRHFIRGLGVFPENVRQQADMDIPDLALATAV